MPVRKTLNRKEIADPDIWAFLNDSYPGDSEPYSIDVFMLLGDPRKLEMLWREYRSQILPAYIQNHSGRRPSLWYQFDSPRQQDRGTGAIYEGTLPVYRQIIRGEEFSFSVWRYKGVPVIHRDRDILVESECSFLRRHNLLSKAEEEKLTGKDFKPECYFDILIERIRLRPY